MKILMCCVFLIANVSYKGNASIDSITPSITTNLLEDSTRNSAISCNRPCKFNVKPRRCQFYFKIGPTIQEDGTARISVNGLIPGPPIHVCLNDIIIVEVQNKIPDQDIAMHWHGVEQKGTPYMDGVPMVTQCPIAYGSTFKYAFIASTPGTYFYHADSVQHHSDGVFGALVVNQPQPLEPHSSLYDFDRSSENTILVSAQFSRLLTGNLEDLSKLRPSALFINGVQHQYKIFMVPNFGYRVRFINAVAVECPVVISIDQHDMLIVATDGKPVKPVSTRNIQLYPGERMDVVVRSSQDIGGYWVRVLAVGGVCDGLRTDAMLLYQGFNYTSMLQQEQKETNHYQSNVNNVMCGQRLESLYATGYEGQVQSVYLGIDRVKAEALDNDFRYISDAIPKKPFYPVALSVRENGVVQINGKSFLYPDTPLLLKPREDFNKIKCFVGEETKQQEPQCLLSLNTFEGQLLELALVNEGFGSNDSYTFHLHGYNMQVVATWQQSDDKPLSKTEFFKLDMEKKFTRNTEYAPVKDTVVVPNKGVTIVRIKPDCGGTWILECRSCSLSSLPTALVINVPLSIPKPVLDILPKCGSYRPPDVLLN